MLKLTALALLGRYFVVSPCVLSVFLLDGGRRRRLVRRHWPFIVTEVCSNGLKAQNTATGHLLNLSMDELLSWEGDLENPPHYFRPLVFHLNSQIYWNARDLWKEALPAKLAA